jgi:hypothetical protein
MATLSSLRFLLLKIRVRFPLFSQFPVLAFSEIAAAPAAALFVAACSAAGGA